MRHLEPAAQVTYTNKNEWMNTIRNQRSVNERFSLDFLIFAISHVNAISQVDNHLGGNE